MIYKRNRRSFIEELLDSIEKLNFDVNETINDDNKCESQIKYTCRSGNGEKIEETLLEKENGKVIRSEHNTYDRNGNKIASESSATTNNEKGYLKEDCCHNKFCKNEKEVSDFADLQTKYDKLMEEKDRLRRLFMMETQHNNELRTENENLRNSLDNVYKMIDESIIHSTHIMTNLSNILENEIEWAKTLKGLKEITNKNK